MPALIRAGAVGPAAKQAKSGGAGHRARQWVGQWCPVRTLRKIFSKQSFMGLRPTRK